MILAHFLVPLLHFFPVFPVRFSPEFRFFFSISGPFSQVFHLLFSQSLQDDQRVVLVKYQKLVQQKDYLESVLNRVGIATPGLEDVWNYHAKSIGQGKQINFSDSVVPLLNEMMEKLDQFEALQMSTPKILVSGQNRESERSFILLFIKFEPVKQILCMMAHTKQEIDWFQCSNVSTLSQSFFLGNSKF